VQQNKLQKTQYNTPHYNT